MSMKKPFNALQIEKLTYWAGLKKNKTLEKKMFAYVERETKKYLEYLEGQILLYCDWGCNWAWIETHSEPHIFLNARENLEKRGFMFTFENRGNNNIQWSILWGLAKRHRESINKDSK